MLILCDMDSIILSGKVNANAKSQIEKLKETDSLTIISNNESILVNNELLSTFIGCRAKIEITACDIASPELYLKLGMMLGSISPKENIKIIIKSDKFTELKSTFKKYPNVSFGWDAKKESSKVGRKAKAIKETDASAPTVEKKTRKSSVNQVANDELKERAKIKADIVAKEGVKTATKEPKGKAEAVDGLPNDAMIKKYVGKLSKDDCEKVREVITSVKNEGLDIGFLCKIHLPIVSSNDSDFVDKVKKLCENL